MTRSLHVRPGGEATRQRQRDAITRRQSRDQRTAAQQLTELEERPGASRRERNRLLGYVTPTKRKKAQRATTSTVAALALAGMALLTSCHVNHWNVPGGVASTVRG